MTDIEEYHVPSSEPVYDCEYCGRPFASEEWRRLHRGLEHASELSDGEIDAFRDAYEDEGDDLRLFRLKALAALVLAYFGLLMIYAVV